MGESRNSMATIQRHTSGEKKDFRLKYQKIGWAVVIIGRRTIAGRGD